MPSSLLVCLLLPTVLGLLLFQGMWCRRLGLRVEALARVSTLDPLTGLPNGRVFESERWPAAVRSPLPLAVLYIDLDHLKRNNDRYGRLMGDRYITRAAALLQQACRRGVDPIFRLHTAGDESVLLLFGEDALSCRAVAQHILCALVREHISVSIGVAWTRATAYRVRSTLLESAEQAMRWANQQGKGRVELIEVSPPASLMEPANRPEPIEDAPPARVLLVGPQPE